jgi:hypothetical protein
VLFVIAAIATETIVASCQGQRVTAAGVSAGIDMALQLVRHLHGDLIARAIQLGIEYDPAPPFDCGSAGKAGQATMAAALAGLSARSAEWLPGAKCLSPRRP